MTHPLILAFRQTYNHKFPLVLVIGREPNHDSISDGSLGHYDFTAYQKCSFWNVAFSVLGKFNAITTKKIKHEFLRREASPIVFADAFPMGIKNFIVDKHSIRKMQLEDLVNQANAIFLHKNIIERTSLIIFSGLSHTIYDQFKALISTKSEKYNIRTINAPFFYPTNTPAILKSFQKEDIELLNKIYEIFIQNSDPKF